MKSKSIVSLLILMCLVAICSVSSFAATKVYLYPDYINTVDSKSIDATSSNYYAYCSYTGSGCSIEIMVPGAPSTHTLSAGQGHGFTRAASSSGNMDVTGTLHHMYNSGSASAYVEKR